MPTELERRARELLAEAYTRAGFQQTAERVLAGAWDTSPQISAIAAALTAARPNVRFGTVVPRQRIKASR